MSRAGKPLSASSRQPISKLEAELARPRTKNSSHARPEAETLLDKQFDLTTSDPGQSQRHRLHPQT